MNEDMRRRLETPPEVTEQPDGTWLARRLGLAGTGPSYWHALGALVEKERLHTDTRPWTPWRERVEELAAHMREGMSDLLAKMEG
jgi:hypothetical protein